MASATSLCRSAAVRMTSCSRRSLSTLSYPARIGPLCRLSTAIQPTSSWIQPPQKSQCSTIASSGRSCNSSHRRRAVSEQQQQQQPSPHSYSHSLLQQRRRSSIATKAYNNTVDLVAKESYATDKIAVELASTTPAEWSGDLLIVGIFEDLLTIPEDKDSDELVSFDHADLKQLDESLGGVLTSLLTPKFKGKSGSSESSRVIGMKTKGVAIVGLGKKSECTLSTWKSLGTTIAAAAKSCNAQTAAVTFPGLDGQAEAGEQDFGSSLGSGLYMGSTLGSYADTRFKKEQPKADKLTHISLLGLTGECKESAEKSIPEASAIAEGILTCKELVSAPANKLTPATLAAQARAIAESSDAMSIKILNQKECEDLGMGAYLGVSAASDLEPQFIHLTYKNGGDDVPKVAIIGKGLTYDSGGYNIKPSAGGMMELMKFDMGGAGATIGAARALADMKLENIEVHFIVAACENMVSGKGMRPGDILTASNGKTIEVNNTDAEGRLTLADALVYTEKLGVSKIIDLATLTGACIIGLGDEYAGLFSTSEELAEEVKTAAKAAGELVWQMPMPASYREQLKSSIADMKNTGSRAGGSITAALFLSDFVSDKVQWLHLDIAGPVWSAKSSDATGFGVTMLTTWLKMQTK